MIRERREALEDGGMLAAVLVVAALPYVGSLGFSSDDWVFLSVMHLAGDQSLIGLVREKLGFHANLEMRPTQVLHQALLYRAFGLDPLGYHLINVALMTGVALALYAVLRRVGIARIVAFAVPAVYGLTAIYSTNRFWFASFGYTISIGLWLASVHADLSAVGARSVLSRWTWKAVALTALLAAGFGYEVVVPLFLVNIVLAEAHARRLSVAGLARAGTRDRLLLHAGTLVVLATVALYKASFAEGAASGGTSAVFHAVRVATGALLTDFGSHGLALPHTAWWAAPAAGAAGLGAALLVGAAIYAHLVRAAPDGEGWPRRAWGRLALAGTGIYVLGYAIFATTARVQFSSTGIANRVAAAAAIGAAIVLVAVVGWSSTWLPRLRSHGFATAVAVLCACGVVVNNGLASSWAESWRVQSEILEGLEDTLDEPPADGAILLTGVCPYAGPAPVFESHWDLAGALQVVYGNPAVLADVDTPWMFIEPEAVVTRIYQSEVRYPYGDNLLMYDAQTHRTAGLPDAAAAAGARSAMGRTDCPPGRPGMGTVELPFDRLNAALHARGFRPWRSGG